MLAHIHTIGQSTKLVLNTFWQWITIWFCLHYFYCISFNFRRGKLSFKWTSFYGGRGLGLIDWSTCEWVLHLGECHFWTLRSRLKFVGKILIGAFGLLSIENLLITKWKILLTAIIQAENRIFLDESLQFTVCAISIQSE